MAVDLLKINRDLDLLAPFFRDRLLDAMDECEHHGYSVMLFEGWRSPNRQLDRYAQGRTKPGKIVTNAGPWQSYHQYALAGDITFKTNTGQPSWDGPWDKIAQYFTSRGMSQISFEDSHFELSAGLSVKEAKAIMQTSGLQAVWLEIKSRLK